MKAMKTVWYEHGKTKIILSRQYLCLICNTFMSIQLYSICLFFVFCFFFFFFLFFSRSFPYTPFLFPFSSSAASTFMFQINLIPPSSPISNLKLGNAESGGVRRFFFYKELKQRDLRKKRGRNWFYPGWFYKPQNNGDHVRESETKKSKSQNGEKKWNEKKEERVHVMVQGVVNTIKVVIPESHSDDWVEERFKYRIEYYGKNSNENSNENEMTTK